MLHRWKKLFLDHWKTCKVRISGVYFITIFSVFFKIAVFYERNDNIFSDKEGLEHF